MLLTLAVTSLLSLAHGSTSSKTFRLDGRHTLTANLDPEGSVTFTVEDLDGSWYVDRPGHPATLTLKVVNFLGTQTLVADQFVVIDGQYQHFNALGFFDDGYNVAYRNSYDYEGEREARHFPKDHSFESSLFLAVLELKSTDPLLELVLSALQVRELQYQGLTGYKFWPNGPASCSEYIDHLPKPSSDELRQCDSAGKALNKALATVWRYY